MPPEPAPATLAVLRFPRGPAQSRGRDVVTDAVGAVVMTCDSTSRGRQVDVCAPDSRPLGRVVETRGHHWQLLEPGTGRPVAEAETRWGVTVHIGEGPGATVKGRGEEWDLVWQRTTMLAARKVPRKIATRCLDVWVTDPACTPAVVAFVVHVQRWAADAEATNAALLQSTQAAAAVQPPY